MCLYNTAITSKPTTMTTKKDKRANPFYTAKHVEFMLFYAGGQDEPTHKLTTTCWLTLGRIRCGVFIFIIG